MIARRKIEEAVLNRTVEVRKANQSIKKANVYLQDIINSFKQPLQVLKPVYNGDEIVDFTFKLTNQAYASYADTTPDAIQGRRVSEIFPGYLKTTSFTNVAKTFISGEANTWMIHYDQDGLDLYNEMTAIKMADEVILHFADYTKLKYLEFELLNKITELEHSNQNLEAFAHAASHDLKEPIRKIQMFTDLLQSELGERISAQNRATLQKIILASERMGVLIDDLLLYSQFSLIPPEKEPIDLNENLKQVFEDLEIRIQESQASLVLGQLPVVNGYKRQLNQMFQNLISNSIKYRDHSIPLKIEISAKTCVENEVNYVQLEIRDNGIGFEQQHAEYF